MKLLATRRAGSAAGRAGGEHAIALADAAHAGADVFDDADELVPDGESVLDQRQPGAVPEVEIGAADRGACDAHQRVARDHAERRRAPIRSGSPAGRGRRSLSLRAPPGSSQSSTSLDPRSTRRRPAASGIMSCGRVLPRPLARVRRPHRPVRSRDHEMVRQRGLEPPWGCPRQPLKLVRLPISPLPQIRTGTITKPACADRPRLRVWRRAASVRRLRVGRPRVQRVQHPAPSLRARTDASGFAGSGGFSSWKPSPAGALPSARQPAPRREPAPPRAGCWSSKRSPVSLGVREVRERQARHHEDQRGCGGELGQEVARAAAAEHRRRGAAAEDRADVRALAMLEQTRRPRARAHHHVRAR